MGTRGPYRKGGEVREEILAAAEELLAVRMPAEVSIRDIADRAGVQHSVIYRHFETKDRLFAEVVSRTVAGYTEAIAGASDPAQAFGVGLAHMADHRPAFAALTRALGSIDLDGDTDPFPGFVHHYAQLAPASDVGGSPLRAGDEIDPRLLTAALMAFTSGWAFLEDWWLSAAGLADADRAAARDQIGVLIRQLIDQNAPGD